MKKMVAMTVLLFTTVMHFTMELRSASDITDKADAYRCTADSMDFPKVWLRATDGYGHMVTGRTEVVGSRTRSGTSWVESATRLQCRFS